MWSHLTILLSQIIIVEVSLLCVVFVFVLVLHTYGTNHYMTDKMNKLPKLYSNYLTFANSGLN